MNINSTFSYAELLGHAEPEIRHLMGLPNTAENADESTRYRHLVLGAGKLWAGFAGYIAASEGRDALSAHRADKERPAAMIPDGEAA